MLERYLSHILTTKFGHIVENLDENKVRVSAWNGEVVLEDLNLKHNSLDAFVSDSPLEIRYGHIGKLELLIPWKILRSRTKDVKCSVVLSDVCILIAPKRATASDDVNDEVEPSVAEKRTAKEEREKLERRENGNGRKN
jgi:vacuolar protein sorting-associated protein 13A/C